MGLPLNRYTAVVPAQSISQEFVYSISFDSFVWFVLWLLVEKCLQLGVLVIDVVSLLQNSLPLAVNLSDLWPVHAVHGDTKVHRGLTNSIVDSLNKLVVLRLLLCRILLWTCMMPDLIELLTYNEVKRVA